MVGALALLGLWLPAQTSLTVEIPTITTPVTDLADVLGPAEEEAIAEELVEHREATGVQLAVLTVRTTAGIDIADFAQSTFTAWGGGSAERNDGALFVLAIEDRRSRLHLGYGLEPLLSDATARGMLDRLRPSLQAEAYGDATLQLVRDFRRRTAHLEPGASVERLLGSYRWLWLAVATLGTFLGVGWGMAIERGLAATASDRVRYIREAWWVRLREAIAALARQRGVQVALGIHLLVQLVLAWVLREGSGFVPIYSAVLWLFWSSGWALGAAPLVVSIPLGISQAIAMILGVALAEDRPVGILADGTAVFDEVGPLLGLFLVLALLLVVAVVGAASGGASSSGTSYSSSGYSSSSYGSSSYGSSSYGSSSYGSSSYSGGGGRSGGGGASSSW